MFRGGGVGGGWEGFRWYSGGEMFVETDRGGVLTYGKRRSICVLSILKFACAFNKLISLSFSPFSIQLNIDSDKIAQCESTRPSGQLVPKWRHINVSAKSRSIDIKVADSNFFWEFCAREFSHILKNSVSFNYMTLEKSNKNTVSPALETNGGRSKSTTVFMHFCIECNGKSLKFDTIAKN